MTFARPEILLLLALLVPGAAVLFARSARKRRAALAMFLGTTGDQRRPPARGGVGAGLQTAALALVVVALAGPRAGTDVAETRRAGLDLVVALDVSASMDARDVPPSRLERARFVLARIAESRPSDRLALVVFAGEASLLSPLTRDAGAFNLFLDAAGPEIVGSAGSEPARALDVATAAFDRGDAGRPRAILLVTDGENPNVEGRDEDAALVANALRRQGIAILALGIGSEAGAPIPLPGDRLKRDADGQVVNTRLDAEGLATLAGGDVFDVDAASVARLGRRLDEIAGAGQSVEQVATAAERYQWVLAPAVLLLVLERLLAGLARSAGRRPRAAPAAEPALA